MIKRLLNLISDTFKRFIDWITHVDYRHIFLDIANFIGDIMHRALFDLLLPKKYRTLTKQEIFTIIFKSDTPRGKKFDIWLLILIGLNVMVIMLESVSDAPKWFTLSMNIIGWLFTLLFTFEFYLRIYCLEHPRKRPEYCVLFCCLPSFHATLWRQSPAQNMSAAFRQIRL